MALFTDPDWQARTWLRDILAHHAAENAELQRAAAAKGYGMTLDDQKKYARPFPGNNTTIINASSEHAAAALPQALVGSPPVSTAGGLKGWSLAAAIAAAALITGVTGVGGALAMKYFAAAKSADAQIRVFWGETEITPERPGEAITE